jgi:hypothetical protein
MFGSDFVGAILKRISLLLFLSLMCSVLYELIVAVLRLRARFLKQGLLTIAGENSEDFVVQLYRHGLIRSLFERVPSKKSRGRLDIRDLPSYIPSAHFALALLDLAKTGRDLPGNIKDTLQAFTNFPGDGAASFQRLVEEWYDNAMERVSGRFKRYTQFCLLLIGFSVSLIFNIDLIEISSRLATNTDLRQFALHLAEHSEGAADQAANEAAKGVGKEVARKLADISDDPAMMIRNLAHIQNGEDIESPLPISAMGRQSQTPTYAAVKAPTEILRYVLAPKIETAKINLLAVEGLDLPLGWDPEAKHHPAAIIARHWAGWLLTAFMVSVAAPLWFDLLNRIMTFRWNSKPIPKKDINSAEDDKKGE